MLMQGFYLDMISALWLGILTSISPCPLATNIAAISFVARQMGSPRKIVWCGLLYSMGRMLVYITLAVLAVASLLSLPEVSLFLETNMHKIIGPLLILVGIVLLDVLPMSFSKSFLSPSVQQKAGTWGVWGSGLLFGSLIPLAVDSKSAVLMPSLYGLGTALPVLCFAIVFAFGIGSLGKFYDRLTHMEKWARRSTAFVFIAAGLYLMLKSIFGFTGF
jgi:cytochrome c-type biogenesis protein